MGAMGADHFERLTRRVAGARVAAVADVDAARAEAVAAGSSDVRAYADGQELIDDPAVEAVVVATWGKFHAKDVVARWKQTRTCSARSRWPNRWRIAAASWMPKSPTGAGVSPLVSLGGSILVTGP